MTRETIRGPDTAEEEALAELSHPGDFPALPPRHQVGAAVVLEVDGQLVPGWYACTFDDDDPELGQGITHRILGIDGEVWEGPVLVEDS